MKAKTASPETAVLTAERKLHNTWVYIKRHWQLYLLFLLPAVALTLVFKYAPMGGVLIAFQKYNPFKGIWGSEWVGFKNFTRFMSSPDFQRYLINTLKLSVYGLLWGFPIPILLAFLLNRIESKKIKQKVQLVLYMPNFISVIVLWQDSCFSFSCCFWIGLGMRADTDDFKNQFKDKNVEAFSYTKSGASADDEIDALSGATLTTNAVTNGVNAGICCFNYCNESGLLSGEGCRCQGRNRVPE